MQFYRLEEKSQCPQISQPLRHPSSSSSSSSTALFNHNISGTVIALCRPIGGMCIILGILTILFGIYRYFTVQRALIKQEFPVTRLTVVVLLLINLSILILLLVLNFKISLWEEATVYTSSNSPSLPKMKAKSLIMIVAPCLLNAKLIKRFCIMLTASQHINQEPII